MEIFRSFADILDYPGPQLGAQVETCMAQLAPSSTAARALAAFRDAAQEIGSRGLEELYAGSFDMTPECSAYVGHHLFGEDTRRSFFLAKLKEHYRLQGFVPGKELPDHLSVMLRFLAGDPSSTEAGELISECMVPALRKMLPAFEHKQNPYTHALRSLSLVLADYLDAVRSTGLPEDRVAAHGAGD